MTAVTQEPKTFSIDEARREVLVCKQKRWTTENVRLLDQAEFFGIEPGKKFTVQVLEYGTGVYVDVLAAGGKLKVRSLSAAYKLARELDIDGPVRIGMAAV